MEQDASGNWLSCESWEFPCHHEKVCIRRENRCDLHPLPQCTYFNETEGKFVAEDEEDCEQEYKKKGLIPRSASLKCESLIHNSNTPELFSSNQKHIEKMLNESNCNKNKSYDLWSNCSILLRLNDKVSIKRGTVFNIWSIKCDQQVECHGAIDENNCGSDTTISVLTGK